MPVLVEGDVHLLPGSVDEGPELLDAYLAAQLERAEDAARGGGEVEPQPVGDILSVPSP
jgi:hypothetical protein